MIHRFRTCSVRRRLVLTRPAQYPLPKGLTIGLD